MTSVQNWWSRLTVLAVVGLLVLLGPSLASAAPLHRPAQTRSQGAPDVIITFTLTEFSITPSSLTVPLGEPVTFIVTNAGGAQHNLELELPAQGIRQRLFATNLMPGETGQATFTFTAPGQWVIYCPVGNHRALGMQGIISVASTDSPTPTVAPTATPPPATPIVVPPASPAPQQGVTPTPHPQVAPAAGRTQRSGSMPVVLIGLALLFAGGVMSVWAARQRL